MALVRSVQGVQVRGGDGTVIWEGTGVFGNVIEFVQNFATDTPATKNISRGEAVYMDAATSIIGPDYMGTATSAPQVEAIYAKRVDAAANVGFLGVALTAIPIRDTTDLLKTKFSGVVGGHGCLMLVKCLNGALTSDVLGNTIKGSATVGRVDAVTRAAFTTGGQQVGIYAKQKGVGGGLTGSADWAGIYVSPA